MKKKSDSPAHVLVYSTNPEREVRCFICKNLKATCTCAVPSPPQPKGKPFVRIERKGRGGKSVTVFLRLPNDKELLKELSQHLKRALGVGGTFYDNEEGGVVEVQGEHLETGKDLLQKFLEKRTPPGESR